MWLTCACTPVFPNAPKSIVAQDERGTGHKKGEEAEVTQDGYAVNTMQGPLLFDPTRSRPSCRRKPCPPSATA